jgi:hypothetical protein
MKNYYKIFIIFVNMIFIHLNAQESDSVFFREDWKEIPAARPVTQKHVANEHLILHLYGPGRYRIKKSHHDNVLNDPYYIWSGDCKDKWALSLQHESAYANLSDSSKIRWCTKQSGDHYLRIILKLADGTWIISDLSDGPSPVWHDNEFLICDIQWSTFDIEKISVLSPMPDPDLSRVDEIGFTDLKRGESSAQSSRLDWIEVLGDSVFRDTTSIKVNEIEYPNKQSFVLKQNYPNPCNPKTTISFYLSTPSHISLDIYDLLGRKIDTLIQGFHQNNQYSVDWNVTNVPSGEYLYCLQTPQRMVSKKLMVIK